MKLTVKQARKLRDLSQQRAADCMGMHVQTYRKLEQNPKQMTIEQALRFCEMAEVSYGDIFLPDTLL